MTPKRLSWLVLLAWAVAMAIIALSGDARADNDGGYARVWVDPDYCVAHGDGLMCIVDGEVTP